jgi:hypothetical protein
MSTVMERKGRPPAPPKTPWTLLAIASSLLLLVWLFTPAWLSVLLTVFLVLLFAYGVSV